MSLGSASRGSRGSCVLSSASTTLRCCSARDRDIGGGAGTASLKVATDC